jgi:predicted NUDIX family NTP pyrophosphohydrolase
MRRAPRRDRLRDPDGEYHPLGTVKLKSGKIVEAWAVRADFDANALRSNTFTMEWPPRSGRRGEFPEVDRGAWLSYEEVAREFNPAQVRCSSAHASSRRAVQRPRGLLSGA